MSDVYLICKYYESVKCCFDVFMGHYYIFVYKIKTHK